MTDAQFNAFLSLNRIAKEVRDTWQFEHKGTPLYWTSDPMKFDLKVMARHVGKSWTDSLKVLITNYNAGEGNLIVIVDHLQLMHKELVGKYGQSNQPEPRDIVECTKYRL